jgi:hypothetical protein
MAPEIAISKWLKMPLEEIKKIKSQINQTED